MSNKVGGRREDKNDGNVRQKKRKRTAEGGSETSGVSIPHPRLLHPQHLSDIVSKHGEKVHSDLMNGGNENWAKCNTEAFQQ